MDFKDSPEYKALSARIAILEQVISKNKIHLVDGNFSVELSATDGLIIQNKNYYANLLCTDKECGLVIFNKQTKDSEDRKIASVAIIVDSNNRAIITGSHGEEIFSAYLGELVSTTFANHEQIVEQTKERVTSCR